MRGGWLFGKAHVEPVEEYLEILVRLCVARQHEGLAVSRGEVDVDHLHGLELVQDGARREPGREPP